MADPHDKENQPLTQPTQPAPTTMTGIAGINDIGAGSTLPVDDSGEYTIIEPIGSGGMGRVYRARDVALERDVAIKFLLDAEDRSGHRRFVREAKAAARLKHENIAHIYRFGTWSSGVHAGQPYLVEEYVPGKNLAQMRKPLAWTRVLELAPSIAAGLAAAHRGGVFHRDIKPANVIVTRDGVPKLVDFGLAQLSSSHSVDVKDAPTTPAIPTSTPATRSESGEKTGPVDSPITADSVLVGTPRYLAPELWQGVPASQRSDLYALGVLLYELCAGRTPFAGVAADALGQAVNEHDAPALVTAVPDMNKRLAAIIDQCLARDPNQRFAAADELVDAFAELARALRGSKAAPGEPYRGLMPFESEHHAFFFGREDDTRKLIERMRTNPLVLIAGPSGVGKSSLLRAGVVPALRRDSPQGQELDGRAWRAWLLVPGRYPLDRLATELGRMLDVPERAIAFEMTHELPALIRRVRAHGSGERGELFIVDQLEELVTVSDSEQADVFSQVLVALSERVPTVRVMASVRDDKLAALARLPAMRAQIEQGRVSFIGPLGADGLRDAIVGPARVKGVRFASHELVDELVAATEHAPGGLPLLQFALSRIWRVRDVDSAEIPAHALEAIGGLETALARHADGAILELTPSERRAAREILLRLVNEDGMRVRYPVAELTCKGAGHERALARLANERLLVISDDHEDQDRGQGATCELAHEALISGWPTLARWLEQASERRALERRISEAARQWQRMQESRDLVWRGKTLQEVQAAGVTPAELLPLEQRFLRASRAAARRTRWTRRMAVAAVVLAVVGTYAGLRYRERVRVARDVERAVNQALPHLWNARAHHLAFHAARGAMTWLYNHIDTPGDVTRGEQVWQWALSLVPDIEDQYAAASRGFEHAWRRDPGHQGVAAQLATVLAEQAILAHALGQEQARDQLLERVAALGDPGGYVARWRAPVDVTVHTDPAGLTVEACPYAEDGTLRVSDEACTRVVTPASVALAGGSYLFVVEQTGETIGVRYPVVVEPTTPWSESGGLRVAIDVPGRLASDTSSLPETMIHIPAGPFRFGFRSTNDTEVVRKWYKTSPLHERVTGNYTIARHETTFGEYMTFLRALPPDERRPRLPKAEDLYSGIFLRLEEENAAFVLHWQVGEQSIAAREGELFQYPHRTAHNQQAWEQFPVLGVSGEDAREYAAWLDRSGRLPGARLCTEAEWERAARGADGRAFPNGALLEPAHANIDWTHGWNGDHGPDEVGSHPASESPFGLHDTIGNAWELAESTLQPGMLVLRSGAFFFDDTTNLLANRESITPDQRLPLVGFRVCAGGSGPKISRR